VQAYAGKGGRGRAGGRLRRDEGDSSRQLITRQRLTYFDCTSVDAKMSLLFWLGRIARPEIGASLAGFVGFRVGINTKYIMNAQITAPAFEAERKSEGARQVGSLSTTGRADGTCLCVSVRKCAVC